ncbi:hypothetical protein F2Q68_00034142 [Brassica cretica]|uniref:Uncharacterized protein n=1 Tax=Brassica cretica TaxID=69181 RepID=A0A8S9GXC5_BRACR|nr:hypothetical protein F2Q68_00034142 [Brassica cretica]
MGFSSSHLTNQLHSSSLLPRAVRDQRGSVIRLSSSSCFYVKRALPTGGPPPAQAPHDYIEETWRHLLHYKSSVAPAMDHCRDHFETILLVLDIRSRQSRELSL